MYVQGKWPFKSTTVAVVNKWTPPQSTIDECILDLCALFHGEFSSERSRDGVTRSFQKTGLMHDQTGKFTLYEVGKKNGTLPIPPSRTLEAFTHDADDMSQNQLLDVMMDFNDNFVDADDA